MLAIAAQKIAPLPFAGVDNGQSIIYVFFTITPTNVNSPGNANPYVAGGDTLDFTTLGDLIKSGYVPLNVTLQSQSQANGFSGYDYYFRPGSGLNNCKMQVAVNGGAGNQKQELAAGNYPAGVLADSIVGMACFVRV